METYTDRTGMTWPAWAKRARTSAPPEISKAPDTEGHTTRTTAHRRGGAPGFKTTKHNMSTDGYLWFRAVRGDDASRAPALVRPCTFFHAVGDDRALRVPVTVLNMAYREAAMLAKRTSKCVETGRPIAHRDHDVHDERVWYRVDKYGDTWVGARLSTLTSIAKSAGIDYVHHKDWPRVDWCSLTWY